VHGIGGSFEENYWGSVAQLLRYEEFLAETDIIFWGYPSSKNPLANAMVTLTRRRIGTIPEVSRDLSDFVSSQSNSGEFKRVVLVGHSLGGIVCINALDVHLERSDNPPKFDLMLLATPQKPLKFVRGLARIFRMNPQLMWLASNYKMNSTFGVALQNLRKHGCYSAYTHYSMDEIVPLEEAIPFDERKNCPAKHTWMSFPSDRGSSPSISLMEWLETRILLHSADLDRLS